MANYKTFELGKISEISKRENGKAFLHDALQLTSCEISVNCVPKGYKVPFNHKHKQNEEIYIIIKGEGIIEIDGSPINVKEGTSVIIAPPAIRTIENAGNEDLQFICIQAKANSLEQFGMSDGEIC